MLPVMESQAAFSEALEQGRAAFARNAWRDAYEWLSEANRAVPLDAQDLEMLATASYLLGKDAEGADLTARVHHAFLERGEVGRAVRCAYWLAQGLMHRGEHARAGGWLARGQRLLDENKLDCVERGYLMVPDAVRAAQSGDGAEAYRLFSEAAEIAARFGDPSLSALARHGQGRALIRLGDIGKGLALLDDTMVAIEAGEVSPSTAGMVYCSLIEACTEIFDLRRAQEWTNSLSRWCESQPDLVPFRGACLIHRAELMQLHGDWPSALTEAQRACAWLSEPPPPQPSVAAALYRKAELHRLRGDFALAEEAYRESNKWSRKPRPGMAQLRLAMGEVDVALSAIRILLDEAQGTEVRPKVLAAAVEIALAAGDLPAARAAADELSQIAAETNAALLSAMAAHATGAVLLAEGAARAALVELRRACITWQELGAPYEAARVRELVGLAARALGDHDTATMELDAARSAFQQLGAAPDLERIDSLSRRARADTAGGLTARELQVLRLVAQGKTNKAIARELFISEKTVHRHLSNIFLKLGLSSRAAATAYAFQNDLV